MIIFAKADGQVIQTQPTPIYQGSSLKGSVYLVAPFPSSNGVTIQFQLPNGNVTKAYPMTPTGEIEGVKFENTEMSAWVWDVANSMVTANPGVVGVTMLVYEASPNITYYGSFPTSSAIEYIENPQTNAYAYCIDDGKVYKYNGSEWEEGDITINAQDYQVTAITTSFPVIKGVPNAVSPSNPTASEWNTIISLLNNIGSKVTQPLMTNFTYDVNTGKSTKTFNNGAVETVNFPSYIDNSITEYEGFAKMDFTAGVNSDNWVNNSGSYSLTLALPVTLPNGLDYDVVVYKNRPNDKAEKMYPTIDISPTSITIHSENPYMGYALITKRGTYVGEEIVTEINQATSNAATATSKAQSAADRANIATFNANTAAENAETATTRANNIAQTLETAYVNGDFVGAQGEEGESIYPVYDGEVIDNNPSSGSVFFIDTSIVGIQNADKPIRVGDSIVDGLGNIYLVDYIVNPTRIRVSFTGTNIRGPIGPQGPEGPQGPQGLNAFPNVTQNESTKVIILNGAVVPGKWDATFINEQGDAQRPLRSQYNGGGGAKAEMVATPDSARFKFVFGWTDPQAYIDINKDRIEFSKPITVQGKPIGDSSKSILSIAGADSYMSYNIYFKIPTAGAKKITVNYTEQYNVATYEPEFANKNVVIFENGQPLNNIYFTLLTNDYSAETKVTIPLEWQNDDTFKFDFYTASEYQWGGSSTSMLLTIEY